jgi:hypothetical protein
MAAEKAAFAAVALCAALLLFAGASAAEGYPGFSLSPLVGMKPLEGVPMGGIFANERINVYVDGQAAGSIVIVDGTITEASDAALPDPTMNFRTSSETALSIAAGQKTFAQCLTDGSITYEGVGAVSAIKAFFAGIGLWFYSLFN